MSEAILDDGLTDEERAALAEEDGGTEAPPAEEPAVEDVTPEEPKAEEPAAEDPAPEPAPAEEVQQAAPILVAQPPEDVTAKLADIDARKEALLTQFDDGDITAREYQKQLDALAREERNIELQKFEAEIAQKMEQQRLQNDWTATCNTFLETHAIYKDNPRLYKALDQEVRDLAVKPETATWSGQKFLEEAHTTLPEAFGLKDSAPDATRPQRELPPNLAKVPAADVQDTNGGKYAVLDRLASSDPLAYEDALAKMPDAERNAYLAS